MPPLTGRDGGAVGRAGGVGPAALDLDVAFEEAPEGMLVADDDRRCLAGNRAIRELLDVSLEELTSLRVDDLTPKDLRARLERRWRDFLDAGHQGGTFEFETPRGRRVAVQFAARANYAPGRHVSILRRSRESVAPGAAAASLTAREREVLSLLARGATGAAVADELHVSPTTVATHVRNAMRKLGARTRIEAIVIALRRREIELG